MFQIITKKAQMAPKIVPNRANPPMAKMPTKTMTTHTSEKTRPNKRRIMVHDLFSITA